MSCNGCRVLRKGCSDACVLRPSIEWIDGAQPQANATVFVAKFFGRAGGSRRLTRRSPAATPPRYFHFIHPLVILIVAVSFFLRLYRLISISVAMEESNS
jgi:hypothetical protein